VSWADVQLWIGEEHVEGAPEWVESDLAKETSSGTPVVAHERSWNVFFPDSEWLSALKRGCVEQDGGDLVGLLRVHWHDRDQRVESPALSWVGDEIIAEMLSHLSDATSCGPVGAGCVLEGEWDREVEGSLIDDHSITDLFDWVGRADGGGSSEGDGHLVAIEDWLPVVSDQLRWERSPNVHGHCTDLS